jgi:hypothetical protein
LLKNKKKSTYNKMFDMLLQLEGPINPEIIITDFESSAINVLRSMFPSARVNACMFRLGQAVDRKIKI